MKQFPTLKATAITIAAILILTGASLLIRKRFSDGLVLLAFGTSLLVPLIRERSKPKEPQVERYSIHV